MFLPTTRRDLDDLGWDSVDVILVSGDTYVDNSYNGTAVIGHWLANNGFKVGVIAQPDMDTDDIARLGQPNLFWGVSAGCVDSMVANYTPTNKFRKDDDFTPGGVNDRRPDRACIAYTNLIKKHAKGKPIILGGVEASLRRVVHYDAWSDSLRRSVLFDSKADAITYGMGELANLRIAQCIRDGRDWSDVRGICRISKDIPQGYIEIPGFEDCVESKDAFIDAFKTFYCNNDPITAKGLAQKHGDRYLIHNPPSETLSQEQLDGIYESDYENDVHPYYGRQGAVKSLDTVRNSITSHRGCYGECSFCAIALMQGRTVVSRSEESILREARKIASKPRFNGYIRDVGGPTANMYGIECQRKTMFGACRDRMCLYPTPCVHLRIDHSKQIELLRKIEAIDGVKKVFIASGIRHDMIVADRTNGEAYLRKIVADNVSGQMKIAPEHVSDEVLRLMCKPGRDVLLRFKEMFDSVNDPKNEKFLTYYLIAAHPGCYDRHMEELSAFCRNRLKTNPEQVQIFTPTPSTPSTMMYYTRRDWENMNNLKCEHSMQMKQRQKDIVLEGPRKVKEDGIRRSGDIDAKGGRRGSGCDGPAGDRLPQRKSRGAGPGKGVRPPSGRGIKKQY